MDTDTSKSECYNKMADEYIEGLKTGWSLASDFAQYGEKDWEREKKRRIKHYQEEAEMNDSGRDQASHVPLMRMVSWSGVDEQEPEEERYLYLACTELVGPRADEFVVEGYRLDGRYYAFVEGATGATEISKDSIDYWMYKNTPEHPDN